MPTGLERTVTGEQPRTLPVAAIGTALAPATCTKPVATLASTATSLGSGPEGQAWILSSMSPGVAVELLAAGAVGDGYGRHRMFGAGAAALAATPVLAVLAPDTTTLGFPRDPHRTRATGVRGASWGAGIAVGPLLARAAAGALGWRSTYWLIAALPTSLALLSWLVLTESRAKAHRRNPVDLPGMLLPGAALAGVLPGLVEARTSWDRPLDVGLLTGGVAPGAVFAVVELRRRAPMLDLRLLGPPDFADATIGGAGHRWRGDRDHVGPAHADAARRRPQRLLRSGRAVRMVGYQRADRVACAPAAGTRLLAGPSGQTGCPAAPGPRQRRAHLAPRPRGIPVRQAPARHWRPGAFWPCCSGTTCRSKPDGSAHDHSARLAIRPAGTPAAIAMPGQLPNLCGAGAPTGSCTPCSPAPQPRLNRSPGGPCTGSLREGRAASVPATDAATESPDPWRPPMPGSHLPIRPGRRTTSAN